MALTLVLLTAFAAVIGGLAATSFAAGTNSTTSGTTTAQLAATSLAVETGSTTSEASTAAASELSSNVTDLPLWGMGSYQLESFS